MEAQETRRDPRESWFVWVGPGHLAQGEMAISYQRWFSHEIVQPQMTKANMLTTGGGGDHIADLHLLFRHDDPINEQFDELSFLLERGFSQSLLHPLAQGLDGLHHSC